MKLAEKALLYEVSATPKPGLVDRNNAGAHHDMDYYTFLDSSIALMDYFYNCAMAGLTFDGPDYRMLLEGIRPIGIKAEHSMFEVTNGVNTHKGIIFSLGIISAAAGLHYKNHGSRFIPAEEISQLVKLMCDGITEELKNVDYKRSLTYGEKMFKKYGVKGVRGEAESGFKTALQHALPLLKDLINAKVNINDILVHILLALIANTEDSNILGRHNMEMLEYARNKARTALSLGGYLTPEGKEFVWEMDRDFIQKNVSPGGAADLIAVTMFLYFLENGDNILYTRG
ncbi:MAG TPA: triphosphoribosyl-dephospho-CoA synthase CitG [Clostridiales bacterium]|jgi:triphosphoribosyl-dephospho-CoA synthase|nr:triphosphoribosyl-dephospho-CoA synthase CitG [Clostridiales bacterium]